MPVYLIRPGMKDTDIKKSIKYRSKIQRLTRLFNSRKTELAAGYQGYHELSGFIDQCQRWGITDRGQEKSLDDWIDLLERWPFVGGAPAGTLSHHQRQKTMVREQYKCTMCGRTAEEVHHKVPRSKGGKNDPGNLVVLCRECHEMLHRKR